MLTRLAQRHTEHVAVVGVLFDPADDASPWRRGDVLIARNAGRPTPGRSVLRLRRQRLRRSETWAIETIWADSVSPDSGRALTCLALDPLGRLYLGEAGSRAVMRLDRRGREAWTLATVATVPPNVPYGGQFAIAADGTLHVSSGVDTVPGSVHVSTIGFGDPPAADAAIEPIAWRRLVAHDDGPVGSFGFYDPDRVVFTDGSDGFWERRVDPRVEPSTADAPSGTVPVLRQVQPTFTAPTFPPPAVPPSPLRRHDAGATGTIVAITPEVTAWTDYLRAHDEALDLIRWEVAQEPGDAGRRHVALRHWDDHPETASFVRLLHRCYGAAAVGRSGPLGHRREIDPLTGAPRLAPERTLLDADDWYLTRREISPRDASELMLAYLGVQLWVEVAELTGHRAADLSLHVFDPAWSLFRRIESTDGRVAYFHPGEEHADVVPNDPVPALELMRRHGLLRATAEETVFAIGDWMRRRLHHGKLDLREHEYVGMYGHDGEAPLTTVLEATESTELGGGPRHWAWKGCHTAAGVYVLLARLANVPGDAPRLWEHWDAQQNGGQWHRGVRFGLLGLRAHHADDFYATSMLRDERVTARDVFNVGGAHTFAEMEGWAPGDVTTQHECDVSMSNYHRLVAEIATRTAAHQLLVYFWAAELIREHRWPGSPGSCEQKWPLVAQEVARRARSGGRPWQLAESPDAWAQRVFCESSDTFVGAIETALSDRAGDLPPGDFEDPERLEEALDLYLEDHADWLAKRG